MGKKQYEDRVKFLHERAGSLASDGRFSKGDYEALYDDFGKVKGYGVGAKKSDLSRYIARALYENDAVLDSAAEDLANKYNKGGLTQTKDSSGRLQTSFKESTGGGSPIDQLLRPYSGKGNKEWYKGEYANAPISNIENKSWTQHTPAGSSTSKWDVYTRTYAHAPKEIESEKDEISSASRSDPDYGASQESDYDPRQEYDESEDYGESEEQISMALGKYGSDIQLDSRIPQADLQVDTEPSEEDGSQYKERFSAYKPSPSLASGGIKDVYDYYSKQITS